MAIYDIDGNDLSSITIDASSIANTMSTGTTNITTSDVSLSSAYISQVISNYEDFITEVDGDPNKIPLIIHTDQHGRLGITRSGYQVMKLIAKLVNWYKISKIINLGDTCSTVFTPSQLEDMRNIDIQYFPYSKQINVFGNHDTWDERSGTRVYHESQEFLEPYFYNEAKRGGAGWFTIIDERYKVKYLIFTNYEYANGSNISCINTEQANFVVREMSIDDGYDIVLLSHQPIKIVGSTAVDPNETVGNYGLFFNSSVTESFLSMLQARKNKTSGTFTDSKGVSHSYDFSGLSSNLLMSLNGHTHYETYQLITNSIFEWSADWFDDDTFYFAYIDKANMIFKRWKFDSTNIADDVLSWSLE